MDVDSLRQIKIQSGVVKRLTKEIDEYDKEAQQQLHRIEQMKKEGCDEYDIKKQYQVLDETKRIIPDCQQRLRRACDELSHLLSLTATISSTPLSPMNPDIILAQQLLQGAQQILSK